MKYLLPCIFLIGCTPTSHQTHMNVADAISESVNTVAPMLVEQYRTDLRECRIKHTGDLPSYRICAGEVDEQWAGVRRVWGHMRNAQEDYAKALETKEPKLSDYAEWLQMAFCQLKSVAPKTVKLPEVPGLVCK